MTEFVRRMGTSYLFERWQGMWFMLNGSPHTITGELRNSQALCLDLNGNQISVSLDFFTGFEVLKYPELGYRHVNDHLTLHISKANGGSGIRPSSLIKNLTPFSEIIAQQTGIFYNNEALIRAAFTPEYDTAADLPSLFDGAKSSLVLGPSILVEPTVRSASDQYDVYLKGMLIGSVSSSGKVCGSNSKNTSFIKQALNI